MAAPTAPENGPIVTASSGCRPTSKDSIINLDHGDPTVFEEFWRETREASVYLLHGWQNMSYFSDTSNLCWFLHPELASEIRRIHRLVGNAVADDDRFVVVGNGSTQLIQAALFALATDPALANSELPVPVVSAAPYYSGYPTAAGFLRSGLYQWAGDAHAFDGSSGAPHIELVCSPNNPDGVLNNAVVGSSAGDRSWPTINDLAYYWPQYTAITAAADHDIMLFTASKCTGHAGTRIGWALVKDRDVARRMVRFIEFSTIGVSKDSQLRAAVLLRTVSDGYEQAAGDVGGRLFHFGRKVMADRWERLRRAVKGTGVFSVAEYPPAEYCSFMREMTTHLPAFAWLKSQKDDIEDAAGYLCTNLKILARSGNHFGTSNRHVRVSLLDQSDTFDMLIERLSSIRC